ncbi:ATP-binding protein [Patulibacter sp. NPDC049589]|uniref:ATP-binding protein n=1 Tax=Patulibacter sp. NPDC049589 TaxID=3154731 RepID=UPI00341F502C
MSTRLSTITLTLMVVVALVIGAIIGGLTLGTVRLRDAGSDSARAERTVATATRIQSLVIDLETGERGFLVTRDRRFLEPLREAQRSLPSLLTWLERSSGTGGQRERARAIADGVRSYERDWVTPIVRLGGRDLGAARRKVASGGGKTRVDALRKLFSAFVGDEQARADHVRADAAEAGRRGILTGVAGGIVAVLIILATGVSVMRAVVRPLRRLAGALVRVGHGDLQVEVDEDAVGEVGDLERGFNAMSRSLQEHHDELEGQTAEVEAQRDDLERTFSELEDEKAWVETLFGFVERLVAERELQGVADVALEHVVRQARADAGAIRTVGEEGALELTATLGVAEGALAATIAPDDGVSGRAVAERRPIVLSHADAGLQVEGLGGPAHPVRVRHELHVPLFRGRELLGVLVVARVADRAFRPEDVDRVRGLAEQAAVALAKAVEERRSARLAAVNASVLDATSFGVVMYDVGGRVVVVNRVMREMAAVLGIDFDTMSLQGRVDAMLRHATDPQTAAAEFARVARDARLHMRVEMHVAEADRWFIARTDPVLDADGALLGRIVSYRESTRDHELQRMRDEFVATVTHELRTPLSSVVAAVDLLEDETDEPTPGQQHWAGMIRRNVDRLLRLVDDLLTVARAESGEFAVQTAPADLATIVLDAAASARAGAEAKGVTVEVRAVPAPVVADVTRMAQAVDNLLANAVKFTPEGGTVRVDVVPRPGDRTVELVVADSGIGIPEEDRGRLFERFYRAPAATRGAVPGTGLGLAITRSIVAAHGGTIRVADGIDGGTAFVIVLPVDGPSRG